MSAIIVFDLNETLLDMSALDDFFKTIFGDAKARFEWFQTLEGIMLTSILLGENKKFSELTIAALQMTAKKKNIELFPENETNLTEVMKQLFAHGEVIEGLRMLKSNNFRVAVLTNGSLATAEQQCEFAQITDYFEEILSAEDSGKLKPAKEAYRYAAEKLDVETKDILMVAAHAWDIAGADAAGCATAFIARPQKVLNPSGKKPKYYGQNLVEIAGQIIEKETPSE